MMESRRRTAALCLVFGLLVAGCGSKEMSNKEKLEGMVGGELKETVPVSGVVSVNGDPVANVNIYVYPKAGGKDPVATAQSGEGGTFCLTTYELCDGIPAGEYRLAFSFIPKAGKGKDEGTDLLDGKYRDPSKSEFTLTVQSEQPQTDVKYDLTN